MTDSLRIKPLASEEAEAEAVVIGLGGCGGPCRYAPSCGGKIYNTGMTLDEYVVAITNQPTRSDYKNNYLYECDACGAGKWTDEIEKSLSGK